MYKGEGSGLGLRALNYWRQRDDAPRWGKDGDVGQRCVRRSQIGRPKVHLDVPVWVRGVGVGERLSLRRTVVELNSNHVPWGGRLGVEVKA